MRPEKFFSQAVLTRYGGSEAARDAATAAGASAHHMRAWYLARIICDPPAGSTAGSEEPVGDAAHATAYWFEPSLGPHGRARLVLASCRVDQLLSIAQAGTHSIVSPPPPSVM